MEKENLFINAVKFGISFLLGTILLIILLFLVIVLLYISYNIILYVWYILKEICVILYKYKIYITTLIFIANTVYRWWSILITIFQVVIFYYFIIVNPLPYAYTSYNEYYEVMWIATVICTFVLSVLLPKIHKNTELIKLKIKELENNE